MTWHGPVGSATFIGAAPVLFLILVILPDAKRWFALIIAGAAATLYLLFAANQRPSSQFFDLDPAYRMAFAASLFSAVAAAALFHAAALRFHPAGVRRVLIGCAAFCLGAGMTAALYDLWANFL